MGSKATNPFLCQTCQIWDNPNSFNTSWPHRPSARVTLDTWVTLDELAANPQCMVCATAKSSVKRRLSTMGITSFAAVYVSAPVPNYLFPATTDYRDTSMLSRISTSTSTGIEVRVLLFLNVHVEFESQAVRSNTDTPLYFSLQPQILLVYSKSMRSSSDSTFLTYLSSFKQTDSLHLVSVQPCEAYFFNVTLLKQWLMGCAKLHGEQCRKNLNTNMSKWPTFDRRSHVSSHEANSTVRQLTSGVQGY